MGTRGEAPATAAGMAANPASGWRRLWCLRRVQGAFRGALLAVALILPQGLRADDGARLAATCTGCHGTDGHTTGDALPPLAGQPLEALLASLRAFKAGERSATVMTQIAKGYSDEQLERIAAFFASEPEGAGSGAAPPAPERGR